jgi:hypothetical protein
LGECEYLQTCIFFNDQMILMPGTAGIMKYKYCKRSFETCARYVLVKALGRERVPSDLYPDEGSRAQKIISEVRSTSR